MPLAMNREVFITCAVTGSGGTHGPQPARCRGRRSRSPMPRSRRRKRVPRSCTVHVRDPETGKAARVTCSSTRGDGPHPRRRRRRGAQLHRRHGRRHGVRLAGEPAAAERPGHRHGRRHRAASSTSVKCLPEICTLDCGTMNFAEARLRHDQHAGHAARDGRHDDRDGRQAGDRGIRHRPSAGSPSSLSPEGVLESRMRWCSCAWACRGARRTISTLSWRWSPTCRRTGTCRRSRSGATRWPMSRRRCWPAATCASAWRTISGWTRACSRPMRNWSSGR